MKLSFLKNSDDWHDLAIYLRVKTDGVINKNVISCDTSNRTCLEYKFDEGDETCTREYNSVEIVFYLNSWDKPTYSLVKDFLVRRQAKVQGNIILERLDDYLGDLEQFPESTAKHSAKMNNPFFDVIEGNIFIYNYKEAGKRSRTGRIIPEEYFDITTGEIIMKGDSRIDFGVKSGKSMEERTRRLDSLRPEVRKFANFLLQFRNKSNGLMVPVKEIARMYSLYSSIRSNNVNRYIKSLIKAGILQDEFTLDKLFMVYNSRASKAETKGDVERAGIIFNCLMLGVKHQEYSDMSQVLTS